MTRIYRSIKNFSNTKSFTLIEISIAMVIFAVGLLGMLALFPVGFDASKRANDLTVSTILAEEKINEIKTAGFNNIDNYIVTNGVYDENGPNINTIPERGWCIADSVTATNNPEKKYNIFEYYINKSGAIVNSLYRPITVTVYWPAENNNNFVGHDFSKMKSFSLTTYLVK